jgi:hypothetical protein
MKTEERNSNLRRILSNYRRLNGYEIDEALSDICDVFHRVESSPAPVNESTNYFMSRELTDEEWMKRQERFQKTAEVLAKFGDEKGQKYQKSAMFHKVVQMIANGMNEYDVILSIIDSAETLQSAFEEYVKNDTRPIVFYPPQSNK